MKEDLRVVPDSPLANLLEKLPRRERRLLLATLQAAPGPRRSRMERQITARVKALGLG